jgi:tetratricopeptide (TPR) repeat protein
MTSGDAAQVRGDYEAARQAFDQAWEAVIRTPPENPLRYDVLKRIIALRAAQGELAQAAEYLQMAIAWRELTLGPTDPKLVEDWLQSASIARAMKEYDRAEAILNRVFTTHVRLVGMESREAADDLSRMAQISLDRKQPENAISSFRAAIEIRRKLSGPLHSSLVPDLDRLGEVLIAQRDYPGAEVTYRHAVAIREALYGRENADLITSVDGLAYALFGQQKWEPAEAAYKRLLELWRKSVGEEHPMMAFAMEKMAVFYASWKKFDESAEAAAKGNFVRAHFLGLGLSGAATEQLAEGNQERAQALYDRALAVIDPADEKLKMQIGVMRKSLDFKLDPRKDSPGER